MELPPCRIHLLSLVDPLILSKLSIERPLLHPSELESKSRPKFLQTCLGLLLFAIFSAALTAFAALVGHQGLIALLKNIPMMSHKDVITLVMECCHLPTTELSVVREQAAQKSTGAMAQSSRKAIED